MKCFGCAPYFSFVSFECAFFFHFGATPGSVLATPNSLHFLGGLTPNSACFVQILSPRRAHLSCLSLTVSSSGCHLALRILRITSGETLNCSASIGVENRSGSEACMVRMPSRVSGERRFLGAHPSSPYFCLITSFSTCHGSRLVVAKGSEDTLELYLDVKGDVELLVWLNGLRDCSPSQGRSARSSDRDTFFPSHGRLSALSLF